MTSCELMALSERARVIGELQAEGLHVALPIAFNSVLALVAMNGLNSRRCHWIPVKVIMLEAIADIVTSRIEAAIGPTAEDELLVAINAWSTSPNSTHTYAFSPAEFLFVKTVALTERANAKS